MAVIRPVHDLIAHSKITSNKMPISVSPECLTGGINTYVNDVATRHVTSMGQFYWM